MLAIWPNPSSHWRQGPRRSNWCWAACAEAGRPTARREHRSGPQLGQGVPRGRNGRAATQEQERQARPTSQRRGEAVCDDAEALRRRVEELELENALTREVVEVIKKDPGADLRRLSNREKTLLIDRLRPAYSLSSMTCLLGIAPSRITPEFLRTFGFRP